MKRGVPAVLAGLLWALLSVAPALADPPGPTDYLSEVVQIYPPMPGIEVEVIGGDSFVKLRVAEGIGVVEVVGYQGEPYLRFLADGTVEENQRSPSKYLNEERYGRTVPPEADAAADPEWRVVASDRAYAWHDHRTHWMNPLPPPGLGPGDRVAEGVVPLLVDGVAVDVTVVSVWQRPPARIAVIAGFLTGLVVAVTAWVVDRNRLGTIVLSLAAAASSVGIVAYLSVPAETAPPWSLWALPVTAALCAGLVVVSGDWVEFVARQRTTLVLIGALELAAWGVIHWSWLWPAILPTALPNWLDRFVAAAVLIGALGATARVVTTASGRLR
ncbi:MAG: hypothetical protein QNJ77_11270 [Acidimicrobiia bacterium]|nr:hypothetical protein [Acidimicrobiia bacterium]